MPDKIDELIKQYLESSAGSTTGKRGNVNYPTSSDLYQYLNDELTGAELERMLVFLKTSPEAQALVIRARRLMKRDGGWENEKVASRDIDRARSLMGGGSKKAACPHCGKPITAFKKPLNSQKWTNLAWVLAAAASFALSFVFRRYFMQFLVVTVLAGVKALVELRATKTQILIYKSLSNEDKSQQRLHQHSP